MRYVLPRGKGITSQSFLLSLISGYLLTYRIAGYTSKCQEIKRMLFYPSICTLFSVAHLVNLSLSRSPEVPQPLDPDDEELLRDTTVPTPVKHEGARIKEPPTDKGVSWLVKMQYVSPHSMDLAKLVPKLEFLIELIDYTKYTWIVQN